MFFHRKIKKIGFVSTRFHGTDGVSLETEKWASVLTEMGYEIFYFAGFSDRPSDITMVEPLAYFYLPEIEIIQAECFGSFTRKKDTTDKIHQLSDKLKESLYRFIKMFQVDLLIIENALSIPMHIPFGIAITELTAETGMPVIGHHHDLYWERQRFTVNCVNDYLRMAFPPSLPSIRHAVINSQAQKELSYRRGLNPVLIPNVYDFSKEPLGMDEYNSTLRKDLGLSEDDIFILQPTRVIARKGIEHSIELVARLENKKARLVITHQTKDEGTEYLNRIISYAKLLGVEIIIRPDIIGTKREVKADGTKTYTLDDLYSNADLVTYPSLYEGFGNAFLEAVFHKKPILVNRYVIYERDIEPLGFDVITMENYINDTIVEEVKLILKDKKKQKKAAEKNFQIAKKYFSFEILKQNLKTLILFFEGNE